MFSELFLSNNKKYLGCVQNIGEDTVRIYIYDILTLINHKEIVLPGSIGGDRFAVSNDGNFIASALYTDYGKGGIVVFSVETNSIIVSLQQFNRVDWLSFDDDSNLMIGFKNKTFILNVTNGVINEEKFYKIIPNRHGEYIYLKKHDVIIISNQKIKSETFSFFDPIVVPDGIIISEVVGNIYKYGFDGKIIWKCNLENLGHAINYCYYNELIISYAFDYKKGNKYLLVLENISGEINKIISLEKNSYLVADYNRIIDLNGRVFSLDNNSNLELLCCVDSK